MKERTLKEWFEFYEKHNKLPQGMNRYGNYPDGACLFWDKNNGYVVLVRDEENNMMIIVEVCGDANYWVDFAREQARRYGCDKVGGKSGRHIRPYLRRLGVEILQVHTYSNKMSRYTGRDKRGCLVVASEGRITDKSIYNSVPIVAHTMILYLDKKVED